MNCDSFIDRLDDYLDGELSPEQARALEAHAASCADCDRTLVVARQLLRESRVLPKTLEPAHDLWPGIADRLADRKPRSLGGEGTGLRALAASVVVVVVFAGGMLANRVMQQGGEAATPRLVERVQDESPGTPSIADARRILPASYVELIDAAVPANGSGTEQALLRNLLIVNLAIRNIEEAIAEDPANADLRELLSGLYAQENRILAQAERMRAARQAPVRTTI